MKTRKILIQIAACMIAIGLVTPGWTGPLESANIFKTPGEKQINTDFKPAPAVTIALR